MSLDHLTVIKVNLEKFYKVAATMHESLAVGEKRIWSLLIYIISADSSALRLATPRGKKASHIDVEIHFSSLYTWRGGYFRRHETYTPI